ncbi:VanW family protein [Streptomyces apocyni]|uniref:VanW family protein n=1 Tax=Streptomyces apocyni TaxID=2654677 RepID=UPI001E50DCC2|nr:VanW family protein [Streptomyces apocyni]
MLRSDGGERGERGGRGWIRPAALTVGVAGAAFLGLYGVGLLVAGEDIPSGTRVRGVDIGGMDRAEARAALDKAAAHGAWAEPVPVRIGDKDDTVDPRAAGFAIDAGKTADRAARAGADPVSVIGRLLTRGDRDIDPVTRVDEATARTALAKTAKEHDRPVRDGAITFEKGEAVPVRAQDGLSLDRDGALKALRSAYPVAEGTSAGLPVPLPVRRTSPRVETAEVTRAMTEFATPAMSAPVTLTVAGKPVEIGPTTLGAHLTMKADREAGRLKPQLDSKALLRDPSVVRPLDQATGPGPVPATLRVDGQRVVVDADGEPGHKVTAKALGSAVLPLLTKSGTARTGELTTQEVPPALTRQTVDDLGIKEVLSSFTVTFEPAAYRTTNIGRAAELINGSVVKPGETWSFNKRVGERTKENGFVEGTWINDGQYGQALGGGVSAVATTVFNAVFFAGVKPVEYGAHSFYIERYPEGREATVAWGSLDLRFLNDSGNGIYIQASATDTSVTISFLGTRKYDAVESVTGPRTKVTEPEERTSDAKNCVPQTPLEGFDVSVDRVFRMDGEEVKRETFNTHYTPRDKVTCEEEAR